MLNFFRKKKLPERVLILNALPHTREQFDSLCRAGTSDFVKSVDRSGSLSAGALRERWAVTCSQLNDTLGKLSGWGADVIYDATPEHIAQLAPHYSVIILLAHHSGNSDEIEFCGRMVATKTLIEAFPEGLTADVDITSCFSAYLLTSLKLRNPDSRFFGISVATSLKFRLLLLEEALGKLRSGLSADYRTALQSALAELPLPTHIDIVGDAPDNRITLGDERLKSTVFAPASAPKGSEFIVQIFIHSHPQSGEVEITARMIDEDTSVRNVKSLGFRLEADDKVDFQLVQTPRETGDFTLEDEVKGLIWSGEPASVEFGVAVSPGCTREAFIGKIKIAVNKKPAGDILFKTAITEAPDAGSSRCADFSFSSRDNDADAAKANAELIAHLEKVRDGLRAGGEQSAPDLEICEKCIEMLRNQTKPRNPILRVFISSTSDMGPYRRIIKEQVDSCAMFADMYEFWGQENNYPRDLCCKHVLESDIFVCILGANYGYVEPCWGRSMTEIEYRTAKSREMPILVYIDRNWQRDIELQKADPDKAPGARSQEALIGELKDKRMVHFFPDGNNLALQAVAELLTLKYEMLHGQSKR